MKKACTLFVAAAAALMASSTAAQLTTETVASGLSGPLWVTHAPGDFERIFVLEQRSGSQGRIRIIDITTDTLLPTPFLSVTVTSSGNERGLLGLAFHPDYNANGKFYINYTNSSGTTIVDEYTVSTADPNVADAGSRKQVLSVAQPFSNHNGGWISFGPDGYLYISSGDGGSGGDPGNRSQTITNQLLGKMLRIDVDGDDFPADSSRNYAIPADNPFVGATGDDEIWAYGLRNAWRNDFDNATGDLYIADVGQNAHEEINFQPASSTGGENYGWRCYEGSLAFNLANCPAASELVFPIIDYSHAGGNCSVTGGVVYRGCALPEYDGTYFYADYCSGTASAITYNGSVVTSFEDVTSQIGGGFGIVSFGEDAYGEMYICRGTTVQRVVRNGALLSDCDDNGVEDECQVAAGNPPPCLCPADTNLDGIVSPADFNAWIQAFNTQSPQCDQNGDGLCTPADFNAWISNYNAGCD